MNRTLQAPRDRSGHGGIAAIFLLLIFGAALPTAAAAPGNYKAQRFDVTATPANGALDLKETIVFEFQSGTFRKVWRDVPSSRTDGIEILEARMDGAVLSRGEGPGHITVSGNARQKVEWNFAAVGPSVHTFELHYVARGVAYREGDTDVVRWRLLPSEHRYTIDASHIVFSTAHAEPRAIESHRVGSVSQAVAAPGVVIDAANIGSNGWMVADLRYPPGELTSSAPGWLERAQRAEALAPRWAAVGAGFFVLGVLVLLGIRAGYSAPAMPVQETPTTTAPPEALPAALAAVLAADGRARGYQSVGTLLDLADRGVLVIRELSRTLGVRRYEISQVAGRHDLEDHETAAISIAFGGRAEDVTFSRARDRLMRGGRRFATAVNADLEKRGLLEPARRAVRDRLVVVSASMLIGSALLCVGTAALIPRYQAWPFLMPLGLVVAGIGGIIMASSTSPLSDRGAMEAARWRGFKRYLRTVVAEKDDGRTAIDSRWIVYGMSLGLSYQWGRYLKAHPGAAPGWFVASADGDPAAFAAFIHTSGAASGGHGAAGAAAGGGGSGAG